MRFLKMAILLLLPFRLWGQIVDSVRLLPSSEIVAKRLNYFTIGQTQLISDTTTLFLYQNQSLNQYLLAETPLSIKSYGTGAATMTLRGLAASHTALLWNGINLQNPLTGIMDISLLNVGATQQVNLKLGGGAALFGSGAIGGTVLLDNQQPQKEGLHGQFGYGLGTNNWENRVGQFDYKYKKIAASIRYSSQRATNDFEFRNTAEIGQPLQKSHNSAYHLSNFSGNFYAQLSKKDFLKSHFWRSTNFREIAPTMTAATDGAFYKDTSNRLLIEWIHFFKKSYLKLRNASIFDKNFYESNTIKNSQNGIHSRITEGEWNYNFSDKHFFRVGINNTYDYSSNNNYKDSPHRNRFAIFVNDAFSTRFITLTGNIRQEWVDNNITPTTFSVGFEKLFLKKANDEMGHKMRWILRGAISRNFNVPTFNDLYWTQLGNPNLVNENGWSSEIGVTFKDKGLENQWEMYSTFFNINIKNRIVWLPDVDGRWRPTNLNRVYSKGAEFGAKYNYSGSIWQYRMVINYQLAQATDGNGDVQLYVPLHSGNASLTGRFKKWYATWQQSASSRRYSTTDKKAWTNPFTLVNSVLGYSPSVCASNERNILLNMDFRLRIENVLNTDYEVIRFYPTARRLYRLEISILF